MRNHVALALRLGILILLPIVGLALPANLRGNLSGTWKLNRDLSDDPGEKMREARESGGGGGARGGGFRGRHREAEPEGGSGDVEDVTRAFETLSIVHHDPELRITDGLGREHVLSTDDRKIEEERSAGTVKIRARWKDGHVLVTTAPEHGATLTETYAVTADGSVLTVITKVEGRGRSFEFRRVYDHGE